MIVLVSAKPTEYEPNNNESASSESNESTNSSDESFVDIVELPSEEVITYRDKRKTNDPSALPLRGVIDAIEKDLLVKANKANENTRQRRSPQVDEENSSTENSTILDNPADVNKDFFGDLFNYTRPDRETDDKDIKIPLNSLVQAVESTLVHSALNLKDTKIKRDVSTEKPSTEKPSTEPHPSEESKSKPETIHVEKINALQDLHLLNPITFKPASTEEPCGDEENITTTEPSIQKTKIAVVHASNSVSLVAGRDKKLAHVQHQEISQTVFHSSLAIFPTIPPNSISAPLPTTTDLAVGTTIAPHITEASKKKELVAEALKLKEKFAEIQADPVILSQF